ncbi:hypothetical protein BDF21DRAFT_406720 [Thamnidium elegans]|uniref:RING-type domain-containing protein n=1 Tax=Thamnidium elegans TaxID=101142 RepID=A0A8H7SX92_9FUNG|nr:hypothetical protein INT48_000709 [Thamnidium elegans]KAI8095778.1 hypothetical protein BDF21DRAFT_406720 [Thamnidium elegans]
MGANASKNSGKSSKNSTRIQQQKIEDLVDLGAVFPNGLYTTITEQDYDARAVRNLIIARKIAPFYKGLEDAPETVTVTPPQSLSPPLPKSSCSMSTISFESPPQKNQKRPAIVNRPRSASTSSRKDPTYDPFQERKRIYLENMKQREKMLYNDAVECPICFLYYPANINFSRCCDQPICTECFVQIHRPLETPSVPATCPFCMEDNYGVLYETPSWSEKFQTRPRNGLHSIVSGTRHTTSGVSENGPRRESVAHNNPNVVLVDHIRPNWKNLIPPTSNNARTVSRRNSASAGSSSRSNNNLLRAAGGGVGSLLTRPGRSASSAAATEYNQYLTNMRDGNMDLEDWMVMEAIRLSLAEAEESERKEVLKKCKQLEDESKSTAEQNSSAPESSTRDGPSSS